MALKSSPVSYFAKLHRIHVSPQATRVQISGTAGVGSQTWRGEGGDGAAKQAIAYRLALCWNVLEGIPSAALEAGLVRDLCTLIEAGDLAGAQALVARWTDLVDMTNGRPHDCAGCLGEVSTSKDEDEDEDDGEQPAP